MVSNRFILLAGDEPLGSALSKAIHEHARYVVIVRRVGGKSIRHILPTSLLVTALEVHKPDLSSDLETFFHLGDEIGHPSIELDSERLAEPDAAARRRLGSTLAMVTHNDRILGVYDPFLLEHRGSYEIKHLGIRYPIDLERAQARLRASPEERLDYALADQKVGSSGGGGGSGDLDLSKYLSSDGERKYGSPRATSPPGSAGAPAGAPPPPESSPGQEFLRYPQADFPKRVVIGRRADLTVRIGISPTTPADSPIRLRSMPGEEEIPVLVVVQAKGYDFVGGNAQTLQVPVAAITSPPVVFGLIPLESSEHEIVVKFYPRDTYTSELKVVAEVVPASTKQVGVETTTVLGSSRIDEVPQSPDLSLFILERNRNGGIHYDVCLRSDKFGYALESLGQITFPVDPEDQFRAFFADLEGLDVSRPDAELRISSASLDLYKRIVPLPLQRRLWERREDIKTVQVVSSEPWIPWEILKLWDPSTGDEDDYLCRKYAFSRWLDGRVLPQKQQLLRVKIVTPSSANLPGAQNERQWILQNSSQMGYSVTEVSRLDELISSLRTGGFDLLHFSTHGRFDRGDPQSSSVLLDEGVELQARSISGASCKFAKADHPLVILNACQTGEQGIAFTGLGGWAVSLLDAGVSGFIGTQWSVSDATAELFTRALYENLSVAIPLGEAVREARNRCRQAGDPSWLAYQLYAHPNVTMKLGTKV